MPTRAVSNRSTARRSRALALARANEVPSPRLDLSSLVDVAFLLLTFFVLTSTLDPKETDIAIHMSLPGIITPPKTEVIPENVHLRIDEKGVVWCEDVAMDANAGERDLPVLFRHLKDIRLANEMIREGEAVRVFIDADDAVSSQRLVDVMNCLAAVGLSEVTLEGFVD
ncbi:MAG: biopolymer transporter ExbD [Verrucomicrobiae bacterium]|nr:biopolymer transporter ExbD [Verrucomicrobiae bacterium]